MEDIILSVVMFCVLGLIVFAFGREIATYLYKVRASNPVQSQASNPVQSKTVNLDAESQKIKSSFNGVMISLASIIFVQGIGFSTSIGSVLQEYFGISQFASFFVVLTLSLPLILILRGMQIMTNAILLNKANK